MKRLLFAALLALATVPAHAVDINILTVTGTWVDIDPNALPGSSGLGTSSIRWGQPTNQPQSGYDFAGNAPQTFALGSGATLGTFTHINNPINAGSSITGATLALQISFTAPDLFVGTKIMNSQFIFSHNETSNVGGNNCCPDIVTAVLNPAQTDLFSFNGIDYAFGVTGFQVGNTNFVQFSSPEGGTNQAFLRGTFADVTQFAVPGPVVGAGIPGIIAACAGLVALARRRRRQAAI
jgi:hypothetical protein